jgi:5-methylcytosine-specific restriction endonuclease McrA
MSDRRRRAVIERRNTEWSAEPEDDSYGLEPASATRLPRKLRGQATREVFRGRIKSALKRATLRVCSRRCVYCGTSVETCSATLDHVFPVAHGGRHQRCNLVAACHSCNQLKGDMLPLQFFFSNPWAGLNFLRYARAADRELKRIAQRAVSLALAA